jgi:hypothetical protein
MSIKKIRILRENSVYRFSDIYYRYGIRWQQDREEIMRNPKYQHSILRYYLAHKRHEQDLEVLKSAIDYKVVSESLPKPSNSEIVIHLRLGDILDDYKDEKGKRHFEDNVRIYQQLASTVSEYFNDFDKISIVTAMHFGANKLNNRYFYTQNARDRSEQLFSIVYGQASLLSNNVQVLSHDDFDLDLCYMANARLYVKGLTNVSKIIASCLPGGSSIVNLSPHYA